MKFTVRRASEKPYEGTYKETIHYKDDRFRDEEKWIIELNTLDDLMAFINENGHAVIINSGETAYPQRNLPDIIIYDDYIE